MNFNSLAFLLFLPLVFLVHNLFQDRRIIRYWFLLIASYFFYMTWSANYAILILGSTVVDFIIGQQIFNAQSKKLKKSLLFISISINLGVLGFFKYHNFFVDSLQNALSGWGIQVAHWKVNVLLPVGISFYTFQTMSYTIDIYRGSLKPCKSFLSFALFVSFFPQLVAGPIVRASHFLPQLEKPAEKDEALRQSGLAQVMIGLLKKVCIADVIGVTLVDPVFNSPESYSSLAVWISGYAYAFQIYYDFSGYSDVAIGAARMLGFDLPVNFNRPYLATSLRNFWRRWHISLSSWLKDYLYVALGGNKNGTIRTSFNLMMVMILGGLWHGAAWTFVMWGLIHGVLLGIERIYCHYLKINPDREDQPVIHRVLRVAVTFHIVALCLVIFRAIDFTMLSHWVDALFANNVADKTLPQFGILMLLLGAALEFVPPAIRSIPERNFHRIPSLVQAGIVSACLILLGMISGAGSPFIYFQF